MSVEVERDGDEAPRQSFILRVWIEDPRGENGHATWRGHITHLPSGRRQYVQDLADVTAFIGDYLQQADARPGPVWRIGLWLARARKMRKRLRQKPWSA